MQRFSGASPVSSPARPNYAKSSPLARVQEESGAGPAKLQTNFPSIKPEKLVEVETPRPSVDTAKEVKSPKSPEQKKALESLLEPISLEDDKENTKSGDTNSKAPELTNGKAKKATVEDESALKTIEL